MVQISAASPSLLLSKPTATQVRFEQPTFAGNTTQPKAKSSIPGWATGAAMAAALLLSPAVLPSVTGMQGTAAAQEATQTAGVIKSTQGYPFSNKGSFGIDVGASDGVSQKRLTIEGGYTLTQQSVDALVKKVEDQVAAYNKQVEEQTAALVKQYGEQGKELAQMFGLVPAESPLGNDQAQNDAFMQGLPRIFLQQAFVEAVGEEGGMSKPDFAQKLQERLTTLVKENAGVDLSGIKVTLGEIPQ